MRADAMEKGEERSGQGPLLRRALRGRPQHAQGSGGMCMPTRSLDENSRLDTIHPKREATSRHKKGDDTPASIQQATSSRELLPKVTVRGLRNIGTGRGNRRSGSNMAITTKANHETS